jgi:PAS domain S-box-containing protein
MLLVSALVGIASAYLWILTERSKELTTASATREVQALLTGLDLRGIGSDPRRVLQTTHIRVLDSAGVASTEEFERNAIARLGRSVDSNLGFLWPESNPTDFLYFARLNDDRVVAVKHSLAEIAPPINRHLGRSYILTGVLTFLFIGGLVWIFLASRREIASSLNTDLPLRATLLGERSTEPATRTRSNRLPWLLLGTSLVFAFDITFSATSLSGALYVAAVVLSLSSTQAWHTIATAAWTLALSFIGLILSFNGDPLWSSLSSHALIAYFIVGAAAFGLAMQRRIRGEAVALTRESRAREESDQLRAALTRAEAADARMRTALDRLTLATNYAGISIWEWDLVADMIYAAEGSDFGQRLGTATHLRAGDFIRNFVYVDDRDAFAELFRSALSKSREGEQLNHRYRSVLADGTVQHIQLRARVYYDGGKATRIVGVDWNITREVEAQEELTRQAQQLRDAERRLERASLSNLEGHWETDLLTGQSWVSSSFISLMGFKPGEFEALRITALDLAHPDDKERNEIAYMEYLRNGAPYDLQLRLRNAKDEYRWYRVQGAAERDVALRPIRISGAIQDIHLQKLAEDALRDAQSRFVRAVRGAQDGLFDYDLVNDVVWFSPRFKRMLGYGENELNLKLADLPTHVHPDDQQRANDMFVRHVRDKVPYDIETRIRKKDGEWLWVRSRAVAEFGRDGRASRLSGSVEDITEARLAREQLVRATAEAEAANLAKSTFLATMSHEIRTPMNGIVGMTELLLDTELDRTQREYAGIIRGSADSLLHVINDVLDFSKIEAGKLEIDITDMDLRSGIEDVCALMALQAAAKDVELVLDIRPEVPEYVRGDAQRIRQCLLNLLSNAVKFTQRGEIIVEICVLAQQDGKSLVQFQVRDTGIGMQPDQVTAIFQPFVQADSTTTRRFGGTGLGLSIVKRLVELMEGQVGVDSRPEVGSAFWFVLPLQAIEATGRFARLNVSGLGRRILVVDDNEANRNVLGAQLSRAGFVTELASDGAVALHAMRAAGEKKEPFDVALVDYQMPAMDGAMFGEIVNADSKLSNTRLILLSSLDSAGDRSRFSVIGFAAYLAKPVRQKELIRCLEQVLASDAREWHMRSQPMVTRNLLSDATRDRHYSGRVLVAEDNDVNRKVAQKYLERLGCNVHVVENGAQCVSTVREQRFDLVLMDMQMPVMDGIEATCEIRSNERGGKRTPIVALTANVLPGQLERCLDAGMDDFLGKPIDVERLRDVLERFGFASDSAKAGKIAKGTAPQSVPHATSGKNEASIDWRRIESVADGDRAFATELLNAFLESTRVTLRELRAASSGNDRTAIARGAHKLKGASSNLGAKRMEQLAKELESDSTRVTDRDLERLLDACDVEARSIEKAARQGAPKK